MPLYMYFLHNLLNVLVQIETEMGLKNILTKPLASLSGRRAVSLF
jgi:hypothetical protein